jgi:MFS family permease
MSPRILTREFLLTTLANSVFFVGITMSFVLPVQLAELGADRAEIGHIVGTFGFASLIAIPATGALADRFGRRPFMLIGAVLWTLVALGFSSLERLGPAFYLLRLAQGLAFSLAFVSTNALIVDLAPAGALGRAIAIFGTATLLTHALGPSLGEWVAHRFGFPAMWRLAAATSVAALVCFATLRIRPHTRRDESQPDLGMVALSVRRGAIGALCAGIATAMAFGTAIHFIPIFVRARGIPSHTPFFVSYVAAAIAVRLVAGGLGDRLGHKNVATGAVVGFSIAVAAFAFVNDSTTLAVIALCFGAAHGWAYPSMNALFVEGAPLASRGRAMAVFNLAFNVGITISAFAAGEIAERLSYFTMWIAMGAMAACGALALAIDRPRLTAPGDRA